MGPRALLGPVSLTKTERRALGRPSFPYLISPERMCQLVSRKKNFGLVRQPLRASAPNSHDMSGRDSDDAGRTRDTCDTLRVTRLDA